MVVPGPSQLSSAAAPSPQPDPTAGDTLGKEPRSQGGDTVPAVAWIPFYFLHPQQVDLFVTPRSCGRLSPGQSSLEIEMH